MERTQTTTKKGQAQKEEYGQKRAKESSLKNRNILHCTVDEMVEELTEKLNKAISKKTVKVRKWRKGTNKWWDKECSELKRIARRALKKWRKGEDSKDNYEKKEERVQRQMQREENEMARKRRTRNTANHQ